MPPRLETSGRSIAKRRPRGSWVGRARRRQARKSVVLVSAPRSIEHGRREAMAERPDTPDWRAHGVRVIKHDHLDPNTAQTPGMHREAAINYARVGAQKIWAGTVTIHPNAKTGAHHHGPLESVIYVVRGKARMRWGERLEF